MNQSHIRVLNIFISYPHEDANIATAIANGLNSWGGNTLCSVFIDKALEAGQDWRRELKAKLAKTDILILVSTIPQKNTREYTGWEVGFFEGAQRKKRKKKGGETDIERRIVSFYMGTPPAITSGIEGLPLGITHETLLSEEKKFESELRQRITMGDPIVKFFEGLTDIDADLRRRAGMDRRDRPDTKAIVVEMLLKIFRHLKATIDTVLKPQKQITLKAQTLFLEPNTNDLPPDVTLTPIGSGNPLSIFGLADEPFLLWSDFVSKVTKNRLGTLWREAIVSVVLSSIQDTIDVDNSQVIVSSDEKHIYRVILTTSTTYYDGTREFHLYFVEALSPPEYGDRKTTLLLKGLQIVCRFRFMFLEKESPFGCHNVEVFDELPDLARRLVMELNLLRRDSQAAGLDQPNVWSNFVDWNLITKMSKDWVPLDARIRTMAGEILSLSRSGGNKTEIEAFRHKLVTAIERLMNVTRPHNRTLIIQMTAKLQQLVERIDQPGEVAGSQG